MNTATDICSSCNAALPEFGEPCAQCGAISFFCPNESCGSVLTTSMPKCPACGEANADYQAPAPTMLKAPSPVAGETGPQEEEEYVSPLLQAASELREKESRSRQSAQDGVPPAARPMGASSPTRGESEPLEQDVSPLLQAAALIKQTAIARQQPPTIAAPEFTQLQGHMSRELVNVEKSALAAGRGAASMTDRYGKTMPGAAHPIDLDPQSSFEHSASRVSLLAYTAGPLRVGEQGIVQLRVKAQGLTEPVELRAGLELSWQRGARLLRPQRLAPAGRCDLPPLRVIPARAGAEAAIVRIELRAHGVVIERSSGTVRLEVKRGSAAPSAMSMEEMFGVFESVGKTDGAGEGWRAIELMPEALVSDFVPRNTPAWPDETWRAGDHSLVQIDVRASGSSATTLLAVGAAAFGRGGKADVCWWVRPAPFDEQNWSKLSRSHLRLELAEGQLWATDVSSSGSAMDDAPLPAGVRARVGDGAQLDLAGVMRLRVTLLGDGRRVGGAILHRLDAFAGRVAYVLCDANTPAPLLAPASPSPLWACFSGATADAGARLFVSAQSGNDATHVGAWEACDADRGSGGAAPHGVRYRRLGQPLDQNAIVESSR